MKIDLLSFLRQFRLKLLIKRSMTGYSCEILNGWLQKDFFYINTYGIGDTETKAINNLISLISGNVLVLNIDNNEKKRVISVPFINFIKNT